MKSWVYLLGLALLPAPGLAANLACDLTQGVYPQPVFVEEFHDNESSIEVRDDLFKKAVLGQIALGSETTSLHSLGAFLDRHQEAAIEYYGGDPAKALVHGIESELHYIVAMSYEFQTLKIYQKFLPSRLALNLAKYIREFDLLDKAWTAFYSNSLHNDLLANTSFIKALTKLNGLFKTKGFMESSADEKRETFNNTFGGSLDESAFSKVLDGFHNQLISEVNQTYSEEFENRTLPVVLKKEDLSAFGCIGSPCRREGFYKQVTVDFRDKKMAESVAKMLCKYKGQFKYIFVIMGRNHSDGVRDQIRLWSNSKIHARQYSSYQPFGVSNIYQKIQENLDSRAP